LIQCKIKKAKGKSRVQSSRAEVRTCRNTRDLINPKGKIKKDKVVKGRRFGTMQKEKLRRKNVGEESVTLNKSKEKLGVNQRINFYFCILTF